MSELLLDCRPDAGIPWRPLGCGPGTECLDAANSTNCRCAPGWAPDRLAIRQTDCRLHVLTAQIGVGTLAGLGFLIGLLCLYRGFRTAKVPRRMLFISAFHELQVGVMWTLILTVGNLELGSPLLLFLWFWTQLFLLAMLEEALHVLLDPLHAMMRLPPTDTTHAFVRLGVIAALFSVSFGALRRGSVPADGRHVQLALFCGGMFIVVYIPIFLSNSWLTLRKLRDEMEKVASGAHGHGKWLGQRQQAGQVRTDRVLSETAGLWGCG